VVTNVFITNPGSAYAAGDALTVAFLGGGGGGATANTPALAANRSGGLTKSGAGTLTLTNANTYSGPTIIGAGRLALSGAGAIANSAVITISNSATFDVSDASGYTLGPAQVLQGVGTVNGAVTVNGTITPGLGAIGTLTLNNSPTFNGMTLMKINRNNGSFANDQVKLPSSALIFGGTLTVTNLGTALQAGDAFQLFGAPGYGGSFAVTNLPPLNSGLAWSNSVSVNGRIAVITLVSSVPTNLVWSVSGTNLTLSWPADHTGWRLLMQTNNLNLGVSVNTNDWTTVANSAATNQLNLRLDPSQPGGFFRLIYP